MISDARPYYERFGSVWPNMHAGGLLGKGTFGSVWELISDDGFRQTEAVKEIVLPPESMGGLNEAKMQGLDSRGAKIYFEGMKRHVLDEAAIMMKLSACPNVVQIIDYKVCEFDSKEDNILCVIFMRMERLQPLKERLIFEGITIGGILKLGIDICKALEECERQCVLHRDVKPENLFCVPGREMFKLGDFGTAKYSDTSPSEKELPGALSYIAPEVYSGRKFTYTSDIYSLGMILYRLLNDNRIPFLPPYPEPYMPEDRDKALTARLKGATPGLPSVVYSQISSPHPVLRINAENFQTAGKLSSIATKAVSPVPEDRYHNAAELRAALEEAEHEHF